MIPLSVGPVPNIKAGYDTYTSIAAAWRDISPPNLSLITVRWRLRHGWSAIAALTLPVVPPEDRRTFKEDRILFGEVAE
jgi:hypothetical protein